tara:strand:- start:4577 stop:5455 length:879 start_codon:yes stop_codon:yes gene_type:complete
MDRLQISTVITPQIIGDEKFFARKALAKDFSGLMNPLIGVEHFQMKSDVLGPHANAGMASVTYIFEKSASYRSLDSRGNEKVITPGSMLWTTTGTGIVDSGFPETEGAIVDGIKMYIHSSTDQKHSEPTNVFIGTDQIPEIRKRGLRVKIVSGETSGTKNNTVLPHPLTLLHIFLERGNQFTHKLPAKWSGTIFVIGGRFDLSTNQETFELDEGMVISMANSVHVEALTLLGITDCELLLFSSPPINEKIVSKGSMAMESLTALIKSIVGYKNGKMGFIKIKGQIRNIIRPT